MRPDPIGDAIVAAVANRFNLLLVKARQVVEIVDDGLGNPHTTLDDMTRYVVGLFTDDDTRGRAEDMVRFVANIYGTPLTPKEGTPMGPDSRTFAVAVAERFALDPSLAEQIVEVVFDHLDGVTTEGEAAGMVASLDLAGTGERVLLITRFVAEKFGYTFR